MQHASEPPPTDACGAIEIVHPKGRAQALILCDHAGRRVPPRLNGLGLPEHERARHIGWDIGAADVARRLAGLLDAPAVLCHVSRLVIDPNRLPGHPTSIPPISDGTVVPGNRAPDRPEIRRRLRGSFLPYHKEIRGRIDRWLASGRVPVVIAVHSFTALMGSARRPWQIGVLWSEDRRLSDPLLAHFRADPALDVGDNQPYDGRHEAGFSIDFHARRRRLPHVMIELRQDLIATEPDAHGWADRLAEALAPRLADPALHCLFEPTADAGGANSHADLATAARAHAGN